MTAWLSSRARRRQLGLRRAGFAAFPRLRPPPPVAAGLWLAALALLAAACTTVLASDGTLPAAVPAASQPARAAGSAAAVNRPASTPGRTQAQPADRVTAASDSVTPTPPPATQPGASARATRALPGVLPSPTAQERAQPTLGAFIITPLPGATLVTPIPTSVTPAALGSSVVNVLLIGTDYRPSDPTFRTDTLIVVSINKSAGTVSLLSIPRDLYVYVPKYGMARINQAYRAAESNGFPGGGPALLEQTLLYNLGIPVHFYALVNFDGFRQIVDTLGGIDVPVTCQLTEYKLSDATADERDPANYALYTQPAGVTHMDGALALWYARARPVGGDFFRGYRQRQVLRAIYHRGLDLGLLPKAPDLYADFRAVVETDMGLWDMMQFVPLAADLGEAQIRSLSIGPNQTTGWTLPTGEQVLLPKAETLPGLVAELFANPANNRLARPLTWVEISNGAAGLVEPALAIESLRSEGFGVKSGAAAEGAYTTTTLIDYTTSAKGSPLKRLQSILHIADANVVAQPDAHSAVQFRLILGSDYNACPRLDWMDPALLGTGTATPAP